jgi:RES domain-containing protein
MTTTLPQKIHKIHPTRLSRKLFWRCVPTAFQHTILESGPNFVRSSRYSVRGEFSGLYFSGSKELAQKEFADRVGDQGETFLCQEFEVTADQILDLTKPENQKNIGISLHDLVRPRHTPHAFDATHDIARASYMGRSNGILAPSIYDPDLSKEDWFNLVIFPANLIQICIKPLKTFVLK